MATYTIRNGGNGPMWGEPHRAAYSTIVDMPALIAGTHEWELANTSNVVQTVSELAAADIVQMFEVPAGFALRMVGVRVSTAEGGAATGDIGNASATQTHQLSADADGFMGTLDFNTTTTQITLIADAHLGGSTYEAVMFVTDGTIDLTINTAIDAAIFNIFAHGVRCW